MFSPLKGHYHPSPRCDPGASPPSHHPSCGGIGIPEMGCNPPDAWGKHKGQCWCVHFGARIPVAPPPAASPLPEYPDAGELPPLPHNLATAAARLALAAVRLWHMVVG